MTKQAVISVGVALVHLIASLACIIAAASTMGRYMELGDYGALDRLLTLALFILGLPIGVPVFYAHLRLSVPLQFAILGLNSGVWGVGAFMLMKRRGLGKKRAV